MNTKDTTGRVFSRNPDSYPIQGTKQYTKETEY